MSRRLCRRECMGVSKNQMLVKSVFLLYFCAELSWATVYDVYEGRPATEEQLAHYEEQGLVETCTVEIPPCDAKGGKRLDGSCNNLHYPANGVSKTPPTRVLPGVFGDDYTERDSLLGGSLPRGRDFSKILLSGRKSADCNFTQLMTSFGLFMFWDVGALEPASGDKNTKSLVNYRQLGCTDDLVPTPVVNATNTFDLYHIYYPGRNNEKQIRTFIGGKIFVNEDDIDENDISIIHACDFQRYEHYPTILLEIIKRYFKNNHNYYAKELAIINPCWDDERLFQEARKINIATFQNILISEWLRVLEGFENLIKAGILSEDPGHRDIYDDTKHLSVSLEFLYASNWFLTPLEIIQEMHSLQGKYVDKIDILQVSSDKYFLSNVTNRQQLTQGLFRQPAREIRHNYDRNMAYLMADGINDDEDFIASEMEIARRIGLAPYVKYIKHYFNITITCYIDLLHHKIMGLEAILKLIPISHEVKDMDILTGLTLERYMRHGHLPMTVAKIINEQILHSIITDRFWFERHTVFTDAQLKEIRKTTAALLLCNSKMGVTEIQTHAFLTIGFE